jgi:uncharacterized protein (DUF169 family)
MAGLRKSLAILKDFKFEFQPVGIKVLTRRPRGLMKLKEPMAFCEMFKLAQRGEAFYADFEMHNCDGGTYVLGESELPEQFINGEYGSGLGVFADNRAASRLYQYIPRIGRGVAKYMALSGLSKLNFEPDVLLILANTAQAEIIMRAYSYKSGKMWANRYSPALGCAWLFVHPYLSGELNFIPTGLGFGMRRRKLFPEGMIFISIPFDVLSPLLETLREMAWVPEPYKENGPEYVKKLKVRLGLED